MQVPRLHHIMTALPELKVRGSWSVNDKSCSIGSLGPPSCKECKTIWKNFEILFSAHYIGILACYGERFMQEPGA